jgi:excisionase family DNA binding protein
MEIDLSKLSLLRTKAVAKILNVSGARVCQLAREEKIAALRLGKLWMFMPADVQTYIKALRQEGKTA